MGLKVKSNGKENIVVADYSESEHLTGEKWIDGKSIYRKVIKTTTSIVATNNTNIPHGISNLDTVISCTAAITKSTSKYVLPYIQGGSTLKATGITSIDGSNIVVGNSSSAWDTTYTKMFIIEYTKS